MSEEQETTTQPEAWKFIKADLRVCVMANETLVAEATDPVCSLSPQHNLITQAIEDAKNPTIAAQPIVFRNDKNSKKIIAGEVDERVKEFHALP